MPPSLDPGFTTYSGDPGIVFSLFGMFPLFPSVLGPYTVWSWAGSFYWEQVVPLLWEVLSTIGGSRLGELSGYPVFFPFPHSVC
jgi:hypothetical protein